MVIHDGIKYISNKLEKMPSFGFKLVNHFELPKESWWREYYQPLEKLLKQLKRRKNKLDTQEILKKYQTEVDWFVKNPEGNNSAFYILQKV